MQSYSFKASIELIGINPYVLIPETILQGIFIQAGKTKGYIPIKGTVNNLPYQQTLVKYSGLWRLYINTEILKDSPRRIGESIDVTIEYDPSDRTIVPHPKLIEALNKNKEARIKFEQISPSLQKEIVRYISYLKTEKSIDKNIARAINFLLGKERFVGRDRP